MSCTVSKRPYEVALMDTTSTAPDAAWWSPGAAGAAAGPAGMRDGAAATMDFGPAGAAGYVGTPPKRCRMSGATPWTPTHALVSPDRLSPPPGAAASAMTAFGASAGALRPVALAGGRHHHGAGSSNSLGVYALPASSSTEAMLEQFDHYLPRRKRNAAGREANGVLFTYAEVKDIVSRMLKDQEDRLMGEFQNVLRDRLHEQYESFSKFNEDFMSRQLRESHFDYMT